MSPAFHQSEGHRFRVLRKLGQGTYGKVQLAYNEETKQEVAIKTIKKARIESEEDMLRIRREIQIMTSIRHPHIIHINEVFETNQKIVLVMQYASGGELYDYLGCHHTLPEEEARRIFRQIASAIYYCHKNKICHRDLKLENILLDDKGNAQIADFGLSNIFDDTRTMNTFCGSPLYASPEIVRGLPYKGPEVDCWSLGVLLYTLIYGTMPFDGRNFKELVSQISEGRYEEPSKKSSASGLIRRLLIPEISKRATILDVCLDNWMNQGYKEPLLNTAEKMISVTRGLSTNNTKENKTKLTEAITSHQRNSELLAKGDHSDQNASLFEQMLNYDVKFVLNKLLVAVESTIPKLKFPPKSIQESSLAAFKAWPKKGNSSFVKKIESAYVIPIFEVTSVIPQVRTKNVRNKKNETLCLSKNSTANEKSVHCIADMNNQYIMPCDSKEFSLLTKQQMHLSKQDLQRKTVLNKGTGSTNEGISHEATRSNIPTVKKKGQKKIHSLSLARIFSLKYEKLILDTLKRPEKKQKITPGKITIPTTFDPNILPSEMPERKEIVLPTVNVSENKDKIEKKIDKMKKAALNRNLIRRSNTDNRLRIQRFLKSQAKKMQDFVNDEQRSITGSMEYNDQSYIFPSAAESFFCKFEKGNSFKNGSRKNICGNSSFSNYMNHFPYNVSFEAKWKIFGSENVLMENKQNISLYGIARSKSDIQFQDSHTSSKMHSSSDRSSYSSGYHSLSNTLSVPNSNTSLLRATSDPDGLNFCKYLTSFRVNEDDYKTFETNISDTDFKYENVDQLLNKSSYNTPERDTFKHSFSPFQGIEHAEQIQSKNVNCVSGAENFESYLNNGVRLKNDLKNRQNVTIQRSMSASSCTSSQKLTAKNLQNIKLLLQSLSLRNKTSFKNETKQFLFNASDAEHTLSMLDGEKLSSDAFNETFFFNEEAHVAEVRQKNNKFLSYPNLSSLGGNLDFNKGHNSIISHDTNIEYFDFAPQNCVQFPRLKLNTAQNAHTFHNFYTKDDSCNTIMSIGNDILTTPKQNGRKLCLSAEKSYFHSKFLNDLEKRESNILVKSFNPRHFPKKTFKLAKRPRLEKKSKSFLHLLSLKRIQEAERELEKVKRSHSFENEDNSGSLLEALKTHGYKSVISQRFQSPENDTMDSFSLRSPFVKRHFSTGMSYFQDMDALPSLHSYEENLDMVNDIRSAYDVFSGYKQSSTKQCVRDWLTANNNGYSLRSYSLFENEKSAKEQENPWWTNEVAFDETSLSESIETPKDQYPNEVLSFNQTDQCLDDEDLLNRSDRNPLLRTSSLPEEGKEETVQDRIWRKSFYSRFNNSALSRKEKAAFVELSENRTETPLTTTFKDRMVSLNNTRTNAKKSPSYKVIGHSKKLTKRAASNATGEIDETEHIN